jgi:hypothetical protein
MNEKTTMKCEEFEILGVDFERDVSLSEDLRRLAMQHARLCARCECLRDSWNDAKEELATLREFTRNQEAPSRVKIRLLQEFQTKHHATVRKKIEFAAWCLAAAAVVACAVGFENWRTRQLDPNAPLAERSYFVDGRKNNNGSSKEAASSSATALPATLIADKDGDFTPLPGGIWQETDEGPIVRVAMQRAALGALGLPVNEERAADWIQVDLLMAADGSPQAVRLPR